MSRHAERAISMLYITLGMRVSDRQGAAKDHQPYAQNAEEESPRPPSAQGCLLDIHVTNYSATSNKLVAQRDEIMSRRWLTFEQSDKMFLSRGPAGTFIRVVSELGFALNSMRLVSGERKRNYQSRFFFNMFILGKRGPDRSSLPRALLRVAHPSPGKSYGGECDLPTPRPSSC